MAGCSGSTSAAFASASTSSAMASTATTTTTVVMGGSGGGSPGTGGGGGSGGGSANGSNTGASGQRARPRGLWKARATPAPRPGSHAPENKFQMQRGDSGLGIGGELGHGYQHQHSHSHHHQHQHQHQHSHHYHQHRTEGSLLEFPYPHHSLLPSNPLQNSHLHSLSHHPHQHQYPSPHSHTHTHTHLYPIAYDDDCLSCSGDFDDYSSDCCNSSTGSFTASRRKRRRLDGREDSNTPETSDDEVQYWDYSRRCSPHPERLSKWITRSKIMDTSSVTTGGAGGVASVNAHTNISGHVKGDGNVNVRGNVRAGMKDASVGPGESASGAPTTTSCDLEDWEDLKELFAKAAEMYENQPPSEAMPLLRGVIHECHRFLRMYYDPSIVYAAPAPVEPSRNPPETPPEQRLIRDWLTERPPLYPPQGAERALLAKAKPKTEEKKCKCKDLPTSFYTILGTTLFFFGNLIDQDPTLAYPGEPATPTPYWLSAIDVFEIGENLPIRTSGRGCPSAPEDWRMAIVWGRTLVCLTHEILAREKEKEKKEKERRAAAAAGGAGDSAQQSSASPPPSSYPQSPAAVATTTDPFAHLSFPFSLPPPGVPLGSALGGVSGLIPAQHPPPLLPSSPDEPVWPANSPFALIVERRLPRTRRMTLENTTADEMMVIAKDQFSRGIFHMPHPLHHVSSRAGARKTSGGSGGSPNNGGAGAGAGAYSGSSGMNEWGKESAKEKKEPPAVFTFTPPLTAYYSSTLARGSTTPFAGSSTTLDDPIPTTSTSTSIQQTQKPDSPIQSQPPTALLPGESFSRAKELFTIASEVLDVAERFPTPASRASLAAFADGILSQMKLEANTERAGVVGGVYGAWAGAGAIVLARGRANLVIGTARAEEIEERLERLEEGEDGGEGGAEEDGDGDGVWECDEAVDGREALGVAVVYLEKAREALVAWEEEERERERVGTKEGEEEEGVMVVEPRDDDEGEEDDEEEGSEMDEDSDEDADAGAETKHTPRRPVLATANSNNTSTTTTTTSFMHPPSTAETIEEVGMMLAEALVTLANLTRDPKEREVLYARAQRESGDAIVLDEEEDGMDI